MFTNQLPLVPLFNNIVHEEKDDGSHDSDDAVMDLSHVDSDSDLEAEDYPMTAELQRRGKEARNKINQDFFSRMRESQGN